MHEEVRLAQLDADRAALAEQVRDGLFAQVDKQAIAARTAFSLAVSWMEVCQLEMEIQNLHGNHLQDEALVGSAWTGGFWRAELEQIPFSCSRRLALKFKLKI